MQHVTLFAAPLVLGALILAGCQTTQEAATPAATSTTTPEQWVGTWAGAWGANGNCPSTITVKEVTGSTAVATYTWGSGCGAMPGEHTDPSAKLSGNNLEVALLFGRRAQYTMQDNGDLHGVWLSRGGESSARAVFSKQ